jgi:hypothetical protein
MTDENTNLEPDDSNIEQGVLLRKAANKQLWLGLAWWVASAAATGFALASTSENSILWFGGMIGAPFHWFRAYKLNKAATAAGAPKTSNIQRIPVALSVLVLVVSSFTVIPEYFRVTNPTVGTCYNVDDKGSSIPVACFASTAEYKAIALEASPDNCPSEADSYLEPAKSGEDFICLAPVK